MLIKLKAGLNSCLMLDIVKTKIDFLQSNCFEYYKYQKTDIVPYQGKLTYAVEFTQHDYIDYPHFEGKLYIDIENFALYGAEFCINKKRINKAASLFVVKKTRKINVKPISSKYQIQYKNINGIYYLNHVRGDLKLRIKKKSKLFNSTFETFIELATHSIDTVNVEKFTKSETSPSRGFFSDQISNFNPNFWGKYNYIIPEETLEEAIIRINKTIRK